MKAETFSEAIRVVAEYVASDWLDRIKRPHSSVYICGAAEKAAAAGRIKRRHASRLTRVVNKRLHPHRVMESWLVAHGVTPEYDNCNEIDEAVQAHRKAWLDLLAKEFEE